MFSFTSAKKGATDAPAASGAVDFIKEGSDQNFMADVIDASRTQPVIVDFWAPWCGPCKQLGPALEKAVRAAKGAVRLVKIDTDQHPAVAGQLRVQSIPAVYAFFQGRPVDGFVGAQPESAIKTFVERLAGLAGGAGAEAGGDMLADALAQAKEALDGGDTELASDIYSQILDAEPENAAAYSGLVRCLIDIRDLKRARQMIEKAPKTVADDKELAAVKSALEVAEQAARVGPAGDLQRKVAANPADTQARFDLAMALYADGDRAAAVDALLYIVKHDPAWNEEGARKQLLKFFEAFGPTDPLTVQSRRKLSSLLFR